MPSSTSVWTNLPCEICFTDLTWDLLQKEFFCHECDEEVKKCLTNEGRERLDRSLVNNIAVMDESDLAKLKFFIIGSARQKNIDVNNVIERKRFENKTIKKVCKGCKPPPNWTAFKF